MSKDPANFIWPVSVAFNGSSQNNLLEYAVFSDGVYCRQNVFADKFITYKCEEIKDLPKGKDELHPMADCKIPFKLYEDTIKFFRTVIKEKGKVEAYVLYARQPDGKYFLYVPKQNVGGANVTYTLEDFHTEHPGCYIVADQHSHVEFGAFWSGTDDADDKRNRYSVVSGMHQKYFPEVKVRFSYGKKRIDLSIDDLFADNENYDETKNIIMDAAVSQIGQLVVTYVTPTYGGGFQAGANGYKRNSYYDGYKPAAGSSFGSEGSGYSDGGYGDLYNWDDDTYPGSSIYSSDRQSEAADRAKAGNVIKCDKCGKFTNMSRAKKIKGSYMCNDCIALAQDAEQGIITSKHYSQPFVGGKNKAEATSLGEALLGFISKSNKDEVTSMASIKKLQDFLTELRQG